MKGERLFHQPSTPRAHVRGKGRTHGNDRNIRVLRFVFQAVPLSTPARSVRRKAQMPVPVHEHQRHALQSDQDVVPHRLNGVMPILCIGLGHIMAQAVYSSLRVYHFDQKGVPPPGGAAS
jgi:hypothetical protein